MPKTMGAATIKAWEYERLINDLALGARSHADIAVEYSKAEQTIAAFAMRHRPEVEAKKREQSSEYSHIWSTQKGNRIRVLTARYEELQGLIDALYEHAQQETETLRNVEPDAADVPVNSKEFNAYHDRQVKLVHQIAEETGQLPQRVALDAVVTRNPITDFDVVVVDDDGNFHAVQQ
jgi:hypothetical protein